MPLIIGILVFGIILFYSIKVFIFAKLFEVFVPEVYESFMNIIGELVKYIVT